ncbi:hypothetical protein AMECASPLE_025694 [Ameca splendens]|uniref:Uncharacterized protein n=1 Tax=Ameca splendens TaxID=208324 RepID=A0ABV0ZEX6_9TELE
MLGAMSKTFYYSMHFPREFTSIGFVLLHTSLYKSFSNMAVVFIVGYTVAKLLALLPCSEMVLGLTPSQGSFCMGFAGSPRVGVGFLRVLRLPPTVQKHDCS